MTDQSIDEFVSENREMLKRVLRHGDDEFARACAWVLLDEGSDDPDIKTLEDELNQLKQQRGIA